MKKLYFISFIVISLLFISGAFAQSSGPNSPSVATEAPPPSCLACPGNNWNSPNNVFALDNMYATAQLNYTVQINNYNHSRTLEASNFGFNIPSGATITGIQVDINNFASNVNAVHDSIVQLIQGSVPTGSNLAQPAAWPVTAGYVSYGNSSTLWGLSWTPALINGSGTGVAVRAKNKSSAAAAANIDHIRMTVYYTQTTGIHEYQTASPSGLFVTTDNGALLIGSNVSNAVVKVIDLTGREMYTGPAVDHSPANSALRISTADWSPGIYCIWGYTDKGVQSKKVVISH